MADHLLKIREERAAREKARIDKLRELNLKKYIKNDQPSNPLGTQNVAKSNVPTHKLVKSNTVSQIKSLTAPVKNHFHVNVKTNRPITAPTTKPSGDAKKDIKSSNQPKQANINYLQKNIAALQNVDKSKTDKGVEKVDGHKKEKQEPNKPNIKFTNEPKQAKTNYLQKNIAALQNFDVGKIDKCVEKVDEDKKENQEPNKPTSDTKTDKKPGDKKIPAISYIDKNKQAITNKVNNDKFFSTKPSVKTDKVLAEIKPFKAIDPKLTRKSLPNPKSTNPVPPRKSMIPKMDTTKESVFDRLYKPKVVPKKTINEVEQLKTDPNYLKKVIKNANHILKRHTSFENTQVKPVRRSISAVHFKRISKNEVGNCIHKWASIGDRLNKLHLAIDEGESLKEDKITSAVKSERKKVTFLTPKFCTPRPDELQARLKSWLQKRGKSLDSYHHLQCFGVSQIQRTNAVIPKFESYDDENKENIALDSDSDDGSFTDNMGDQKDILGKGDGVDIDKWRTNDSMRTEINESADLDLSTVTSADTFTTADDLLIGTLNDLTELLKEGYDPEQAVRYLRAIRSRFPDAPRVAAYWECRAALEERRGDLHESVLCWEEAIATGTKQNIAEASLDSLLNKFMQLNISPSAAAKQPDAKLVDVKNVFKSALIRFAITKAKQRQSEAPMFTVTPVRRSGRLSMCPTPKDTPRATPRVLRDHIQICDTVKQVNTIAPTHVFNVNENLAVTP